MYTNVFLRIVYLCTLFLVLCILTLCSNGSDHASNRLRTDKELNRGTLEAHWPTRTWDIYMAPGVNRQMTTGRNLLRVKQEPVIASTVYAEQLLTPEHFLGQGPLDDFLISGVKSSFLHYVVFPARLQKASIEVVIFFCKEFLLGVSVFDARAASSRHWGLFVHGLWNCLQHLRRGCDRLRLWENTNCTVVNT